MRTGGTGLWFGGTTGCGPEDEKGGLGDEVAARVPEDEEGGLGIGSLVNS